MKEEDSAHKKRRQGRQQDDGDVCVCVLFLKMLVKHILVLGYKIVTSLSKRHAETQMLLLRKPSQHPQHPQHPSPHQSGCGIMASVLFVLLFPKLPMMVRVNVRKENPPTLLDSFTVGISNS